MLKISQERRVENQNRRARYEQDERREVYARSGGRCVICGRWIGAQGDRAHIVPQTKRNLISFGWWFIHAAANCRWTCSTFLGHPCNAAAAMPDYGDREERQAHIDRVVEYLKQRPGVPGHVIVDPVTGYSVEIGGKDGT